MSAVKDPRLALLLLLLLGVLVWEAGVPALVSYLSLLGVVFARCGKGVLPSASLRRMLYFALFWPCLKVFVALLTFLTGAGDNSGLVTGSCTTGEWDIFVFFETHLPQAGVLFLRLLILLFSGLAITALHSPYALGLALTSFFRPFLGRNAFKPALALTLMIQYLPRLNRLFADTRQAAGIRRAPCVGLSYWRLALPRIFSRLLENPWQQALALASRHLDDTDAWQGLSPLAWVDCAKALALAVLMLAAVWV